MIGHPDGIGVLLPVQSVTRCTTPRTRLGKIRKEKDDQNISVIMLDMTVHSWHPIICADLGPQDN